jgi:hypothetical protein
MKITALINKLVSILAEHGDVDVIASNTTETSNEIIGNIHHVEAFKYGDRKVVADIIV